MEIYHHLQRLIAHGPVEHRSAYLRASLRFMGLVHEREDLLVTYWNE